MTVRDVFNWFLDTPLWQVPIIVLVVAFLLRFGGTLGDEAYRQIRKFR